MSDEPIIGELDAAPLDRSSKNSRELTVVESDRIDMISTGCDLVSHFMNKQLAPLTTGLTVDVELSPVEVETYHSVLKFLTRQFEIGHRDTDVVETKITSELTIYSASEFEE